MHGELHSGGVDVAWQTCAIGPGPAAPGGPRAVAGPRTGHPGSDSARSRVLESY